MPRKSVRRGKSGKTKRSPARATSARAGRRRKSGCLVVSVLMLLAIGTLLAVVL